MWRIPPKHAETALSALLSLMPHSSSKLLSQVLCNVECDKEFILCEYNRDVDSYKFISFFIIIPPVSGFCWIQYA
ncbi:hypothetical protein JHK82_044626 [Glycine max]|uniref:F-actin-capping protein subunit beta n=2 Tax=Glycine subgen. Soja TaxID=1462606 RepID=A0A0R0FXJ5_SOYBN|nr:hypothetical protein JHK86_045027 [Glycine max]KAG4940947.1 hypothetical protein JHK87_044818 [Glycine soja]KAG4951729.1 hypothetical protein JHK85_045596 [Glycine max]KAG5099574.1 hypothetical protein JHK82_044626 [Glycine max]KAG5108176.1 hypothetical protein JHK84_045083 [Glycine max]